MLYLYKRSYQYIINMLLTKHVGKESSNFAYKIFNPSNERISNLPREKH